jgi:hypothetical protein
MITGVGSHKKSAAVFSRSSGFVQGLTIAAFLHAIRRPDGGAISTRQDTQRGEYGSRQEPREP